MWLQVGPVATDVPNAARLRHAPVAFGVNTAGRHFVPGRPKPSPESISNRPAASNSHAVLADGRPRGAYGVYLRPGIVWLDELSASL